MDVEFFTVKGVGRLWLMPAALDRINRIFQDLQDG